MEYINGSFSCGASHFFTSSPWHISESRQNVVAQRWLNPRDPTADQTWRQSRNLRFHTIYIWYMNIYDIYDIHLLLYFLFKNIRNCHSHDQRRCSVLIYNEMFFLMTKWTFFRWSIYFFQRLKRRWLICVQMARWITASLLASAVASFGDGEVSLEQLRSAMEPFRSLDEF